MKSGKHKTVQVLAYAEAKDEGALLGKSRHLHANIYGNREFVEHLRNRGKFFDYEERRERDLILIGYQATTAVLDLRRNIYNPPRAVDSDSHSFLTPQVYRQRRQNTSWICFSAF